MVRFMVTDNDGNVHATYRPVTVTSSYQEFNASKRLTEEDPAREEQRNFLSGACATGSSEACYFLGKMYEEDGDALTADKLFEKSCSMGYQTACSAK